MSPKEKLKELLDNPKMGTQTALEKRTGIAQDLISKYVNGSSQIGGLACLYFAAVCEETDKEYWLIAAERAPGPISSAQRALLRDALTSSTGGLDPVFVAGIVRLLTSSEKEDVRIIKALKDHLLQK